MRTDSSDNTGEELMVDKSAMVSLVYRIGETARIVSA